jgi:hypothetical protein
MPQRYQRGSLRCTKRKAGPDRWEYLGRENDETGMRVRWKSIPKLDFRQSATPSIGLLR